MLCVRARVCVCVRVTKGRHFVDTGRRSRSVRFADLSDIILERWFYEDNKPGCYVRSYALIKEKPMVIVRERVSHVVSTRNNTYTHPIYTLNIRPIEQSCDGHMPVSLRSDRTVCFSIILPAYHLYLPMFNRDRGPKPEPRSDTVDIHPGKFYR